MEKTAMAVRERCWLLMGLDEIVSDRENQLVDQGSIESAEGVGMGHLRE
jgi:hypothetical protein